MDRKCSSCGQSIKKRSSKKKHYTDPVLRRKKDDERRKKNKVKKRSSASNQSKFYTTNIVLQPGLRYFTNTPSKDLMEVKKKFLLWKCDHLRMPSVHKIL